MTTSSSPQDSTRKHSQCACSPSFFGPGWNSVSITWDFFRFSARAELRPGLYPSPCPCHRQFTFQSICFRSRAEISARHEIRHVISSQSKTMQVETTSSSHKIDFFLYPNILFDEVIAKTLLFTMKIVSINKSMYQVEFLSLEFLLHLVSRNHARHW